MQTPNEIKQVTRRIMGIVDTLIQTKSMVKGSFSTVYRKCGKPNCWCAKPGEKGHAATRITWNEKGNSRTQTVKETDRERLFNATESYRHYRQGRRKLRMEENRLEELLDKHEMASVKNIKQ